jgi:hypothetical protein
LGDQTPATSCTTTHKTHEQQTRPSNKELAQNAAHRMIKATASHNACHGVRNHQTAAQHGHTVYLPHDQVAQKRKLSAVLNP